MVVPDKNTSLRLPVFLRTRYFIAVITSTRLDEDDGGMQITTVHDSNPVLPGIQYSGIDHDLQQKFTFHGMLLCSNILVGKLDIGRESPKHHLSNDEAINQH